ncbi:hypothetical protein DFO73_11620 [Cytobacillus oceanisediminis]|uniref:Uncharacterized protein n=1 Tax=Cytobacillus oceanisediminis TaxID=665099 RepID=A0A2V2ZMQ0_9BACI|nr:hypothetical protein [Cytobacillus oceanisediminis]PWW20206.1 hypothetical protein DFO73_11620 [Cytobacillus oceanisediminis]
MIYGIGYRERTKDGEHLFNIQKHITKEEYDNHRNTLSEAHKINAMSKVNNLLERNGKEYLDYSSSIEEKLKTDEENVYHEANRLLINYLSSLSMFIDYGERHNKKHFGKARMEQFRKKASSFYDGHVSYRFMAMMRQYAVHYSFPLGHIKKSLIGDSGIFADRETLLKFSGWKHSRQDIERMPKLINVDPHVEISMMFIENLYQDFIYDIAPTVIKGIEHLNGIIKDNGGKLPLFVAFKSEEEFKKGNIKINLVDTKPFMEALEIIKSHPSINITIE